MMISIRSNIFPHPEFSIESFKSHVFPQSDTFSRVCAIFIEIFLSPSSLMLTIFLYSLSTCHTCSFVISGNRFSQRELSNGVSNFLTSAFFSIQGRSTHFGLRISPKNIIKVSSSICSHIQRRIFSRISIFGSTFLDVTQSSFFPHHRKMKSLFSAKSPIVCMFSWSVFQSFTSSSM